ncbi:hypothetical protein ACJ41O_009246 [Fusarium nematophilum]
MRLEPLTALLLSSTCAASKTPQYPFLYNEAWAGPARIADKFNTSSNSTGFTMVEATLIMPHLSIPKKPREKVDQYTTSYWIGLDGVLPTGENEIVRGLWQAGVIMSVWTNGATEYAGFHEWIPDDPINVPPAKLALSEGDHLHVLLETSDNGYYGSTTLTNLNTGQVYKHSQKAATGWRGRPVWPSQGGTAEWIVEAGTHLNGPQFILPDWGTALFLDARACYDDGECATPGDGKPDQGIMGDCVSIEYIEERFSPKKHQKRC